MDARLGVTGKGYGAHGLSGHRPQREFNLPAMIERGSTRVPTGAGLGVEVNEDNVRRISVTHFE